jgi:uncharacterized repeat protein (TIGR04052 family)
LFIINFLTCILFLNFSISIAMFCHSRCLISLFLVLLLSGCEPSSEQSGASKAVQNITFKLASNSQLLTCSDLREGWLLQGERWQIQALKIYVHQLALADGESREVAKLTPSDWQTDRVALLSLESNLCAGLGNSAGEDVNATLYFNSAVTVDTSDTLSFTLGVPFEENHKNPLTQPSPLNLPLMFWSWQLGHKFIRWDMTRSASNWSFHLGSLGCESASSVRSPSQPCQEPNTVSLELNKLGTGGDEIWVHIDRMVEGIDLEQDSSCTLHGATEDSCATLIQNLQYNEVFEWR